MKGNLVEYNINEGNYHSFGKVKYDDINLNNKDD